MMILSVKTLITGMNPKASCGVLNPPLRGIVQLTNSAALRFRNWSFNDKLNEFLLIIYIIMKNNPLVFNHKIIKLIETNDMGMLHPGEQP
jgi:hypothetical protein